MVEQNALSTWSDEILGWRGRVGLIFPTTNLLLETALPKLAPSGVAFHTARLSISGGADVESVRRMAEKTFDAARDLAEARVDLIAYCCTASSFVEGRQHDLEMIQRINEDIGIPCITTMQSITDALNALSIRKPALASPYTEELEKLEIQYLENSGFTVAASNGMGIRDLIALHHPVPGEIYRFAMRTLVKEADGILISCNALRAHMIAGALERDSGRPVVTSLTATLWGILRALNVSEPIAGYGRLLAGSAPSASESA